MAKKSSERGIFDLLSWAVGLSSDSEAQLVIVPLDEIVVDRRQPRRYFAPESLTQLANSIRANGVIEPILVRKLENGSYQLIAGERRWRAAQLAGSSEIPAVVSSFTHESDIKKFQLIENLMREDLNPLEEVFAYLDLLAARISLGPLGKKFLGADLAERRGKLVELLRRLAGMEKSRLTPEQIVFVETVTEVFKEVGHTNWQDFVARRLPVINLPEDILQALSEGWLSYEHARLLARINTRTFGESQAEKERQKLLNWLKRTNPTLAELRGKIAERRATVTPPAPAKVTVTTRLSETARRLQRLKRERGEQLPSSAQTRLERALKNLESLVADIEKEYASKTRVKNSANGKRLK